VENFSPTLDKITYVQTFKALKLRYDQHQDRLKDRNSLDSNGVSSILRNASNRFRRDERAMDEDEELWFNDDDCEDEVPDAGAGLSGVSGEPDKGAMESNGVAPVVSSEKVLPLSEPVTSVVPAPDTQVLSPVTVPTIDRLMEEDKKKELLKGVDIDSGTTEDSSAINGAKKGLGLVDYNDSDEDEENGTSSDEDLPPSKRLKT